MHGLWNAAAIGVAFGSLPEQGMEISVPLEMAQSVSAMGIILIVLLTAVAFIGILEIPKRLREAIPLSTSEPHIGSELSTRRSAEEEHEIPPPS